MNLNDAASFPVSQKLATMITFSASGAAVFFGLTANELGVFLGLFIAFGAGVTKAAIEYHFKQKHFKLVETYVKEGNFDRRRNKRREDVCAQCPIIKHKYDYDNT